MQANKQSLSFNSTRTTRPHSGAPIWATRTQPTSICGAALPEAAATIAKRATPRHASLVWKLRMAHAVLFSPAPPPPLLASHLLLAPVSPRSTISDTIAPVPSTARAITVKWTVLPAAEGVVASGNVATTAATGSAPVASSAAAAMR